MQREDFSGTANQNRDVVFRKVCFENIEQMKCKFPNRYKEFCRNLTHGEGVFLFCGEEIVGYGWLKKKRCKDPFYKIGENVAYLSSFFVEESWRGKGLYPAMISFLIENAPEYDRFYISAYSTNKSSIRGLLKVGFSLTETIVFSRFLKTTINKYKLK